MNLEGLSVIWRGPEYKNILAIKGIAEPTTRVVVTTIIRAVVTMISQLGRSPFNLSTSANAIDPQTIPDRKRKFNSLKSRGIFILHMICPI